MSELSIPEIKEKISLVEKDIERLRSSGGDLKHVSALSEYKLYLEDELKLLKNEQQNR